MLDVSLWFCFAHSRRAIRAALEVASSNEAKRSHDISQHDIRRRASGGAAAMRLAMNGKPAQPNEFIVIRSKGSPYRYVSEPKQWQKVRICCIVALALLHLLMALFQRLGSIAR